MQNSADSQYFQAVLNPAAQSAARVEVNLGALAANYAFLQAQAGLSGAAGKPLELMPVIKADAYGHGLLPCARSLIANGAGWLAVGTVQEGALLRAGGVKQHLVALLGCLGRDDIDLALSERIIPFVASFEQLERFAARAESKSAGAPAQIALKFNTGMNRLGFFPGELSALLDWLAAHPGLEPAIAASHLAAADEDEGAAQTDAQIQVFATVCGELKKNYPALKTSLYNSAGFLAHAHKFASDLARPGLTLYGANPLAGTALNRPEFDAGLSQAMQVWAPVVQVHPLKQGEAISYGATFTAPRDMRVAIVAAGYSQGYSRGLSSRGEPPRAQMNLHGTRCPVLGRVCMQLTAVDVTGLARVREGDQAWLLGGPGDAAISANELAAWWGTIPYEVFCMLGAVNARTY